MNGGPAAAGAIVADGHDLGRRRSPLAPPSAIVATARRRAATVRASRHRPRRAPATRSASVSAATRIEMMRATAARDARRPTELDPVVELQSGVRRRSWIARCEFAGIALGAQVGGELRVDDDDQAVVVGDGRAGPRRRLDLDLVRRPASRPPSVTDPSASIVERAIAGGRHDRRDRARRAACRPWAGATLTPPFDELRLVADRAPRP